MTTSSYRISASQLARATVAAACVLLSTIVPQARAETVSITVGSTPRSMIIHAPAGIEADRPLVISMHGLNQSAGFQESQSGLNAIADAEGFLVAYPSGINNAWSLSGTSDTDFILAVIDYMAQRYDIDRERVYLSGFSMGGMMTYYAATRIADKIAAFAPISGYLIGGPNATSSRPIPIIHTHGTADDVVVYSNVQTHINAWVTRNACPATPVITDPYPASKPNSICTKYRYGSGTNGVEVVLMSLEGKGHWISNDVANGIHTSQEIWNFCKNYTVNGPVVGSGGVVFQENQAGFIAVDGTIDNDHAGFTGTGFANAASAVGSGIGWKMKFPIAATKTFSFRYAGTSLQTGNLIVNGSTVAASIPFPSTGSWTTWSTVTIEAPVGAGIAEVRLVANSVTGLPNIDYLEVSGGTVSETLPLADTYVRDGGSAATNFGTTGQLVTKTDGASGSGFNRLAFLRFNVSGLGNAEGIRLKLVPFQVDDGGAALNFERLADDGWSETAMTWNNRPTAAGEIVANTGSYSVDVPATADVTAAAKGEAAGDGILSLRLTQPNSGNNFIGFHSRESTSAGKRPVLQAIYPAAEPVATAAAHLRFDETTGATAADATGHGWNGTLVNGPAWDQGTLNLDGSNDHVTLPAGILFGVQDITISTWVKIDTFGNWSRVLDFGTGTNNYLFLTPRTTAGNPRFAIRTPSVPEQIIDAAAPLPAGVWTHVAVTLSGSVGTLYVDGVAVGSNPSMTLRPSDLGHTTLNYLGRSQFSADSHFDGQLDDFRIHWGALTAGEVALLAVRAPQITSPATASATVGHPFSYQIVASHSPTAFSASGLPAGISLNPDNGLISGTPEVSGSFPVTLGAANAGGSGTALLNLGVVSPPLLPQELNGPAIALSGGIAALSTGISVIGRLYQLQYRDDLASGSWLDHGPQKSGTGAPLDFTMPVDPAVSRRFYRILIIQP